MCRRHLFVLVLLGVALFTGGCGDKSGGPTVLRPRPQFFVIDVPVPDSFELERRRSTHDYSGGQRSVKHFYLGRDDPQAVANFYRQEMQKYKWELLDQNLKNGVDHLNFSKGDESCQVRIEKTPGGWFGSKTQVCVAVEASE